MQQTISLEGKTALITGAAQGIGQGVAELFAKAGATVIVSDINDRLGSQVAREIPQAEYLHLDVQKEDDWKSSLEFLKSKNFRLNILVNNAGITGFQGDFGPQDPEHASLKDWHHVHRINLDGIFLGCKYAIKAMKSHGGSIINVSSRSGLVGIPGAAAYASSKAAVRNHTKTVALYCANQNYNIRCNSIHPAAVLTPMWEPMLGEGAQREAMIKAIADECPLKRFGQPEDVAYAALYLASDVSSFVTGIEMNIDGGVLAGAVAPPQKAEEHASK